MTSGVLVLALVGSGCGKKGTGAFVSGAEFTTVEENGELFGNLKVVLRTGNVFLPSFELPILNPRSGSLLGSIAMRDLPSQGTELAIRVHLGLIPGVDGIDGAALPNGRPIPVALSAAARPVAVQVTSKSRVYFAFGDGAAMIGVALVIPELDRLSGAIGGLDVFFPFLGSNGVRGAAGIFTSTAGSQSGLGVFVDVGSVLKTLPSKVMTQSLAQVAKASASASEVQFSKGASLSNTQAYRLNQYMTQLGDRGRRLRLQ
jgi:hypothetical protein